MIYGLHFSILLFIFSPIRLCFLISFLLHWLNKSICCALYQTGAELWHRQRCSHAVFINIHTNYVSRGVLGFFFYLLSSAICYLYVCVRTGVCVRIKNKNYFLPQYSLYAIMTIMIFNFLRNQFCFLLFYFFIYPPSEV